MATTDGAGFVETDVHRMMRETAREVAANYDDEYWREISDGEREPTAFWQDCADAGFLGVTVPEEYGGEDMGILELVTIVEELVANGCLGAEMLFVVNVVFGAVTLTQHGTDEQRDELLEPLVNGDLRFCMALTEPNAGHNAPNLDTFADEREDGSFVIDGSKQWISGVDRADEMLLVARTTPKDEVPQRTQGITLFRADPQDPAIERRELDVGIPTPERQFELSIDGYEAAAEDVIGTKDMGLYQLFDTVNPERLVGSAGAIGVGRIALDRAVEYAKDREVFGQPIGAHQGIQHPIAEAHSKVEAAKLLVQKAAWLMDQVENTEDMKRTAELSNMAKLRASEAGHEAADVAVQTHGGNGFSREYQVIEMWKGSRLGLVAPGSSEMMRNHIAEHALDMPRSY
ncbi:MAG: acyl-CoA dehydrogenase family protein [Haloarculaceae archaeon]